MNFDLRLFGGRGGSSGGGGGGGGRVIYFSVANKVAQSFHISNAQQAANSIESVMQSFEKGIKGTPKTLEEAYDRMSDGSLDRLYDLTSRLVDRIHVGPQGYQKTVLDDITRFTNGRRVTEKTAESAWKELSDAHPAVFHGSINPADQADRINEVRRSYRQGQTIRNAYGDAYVSEVQSSLANSIVRHYMKQRRSK